MTGNELFQNLVPVLAPLITASVGVLGIVIKDRRQERNLDQQLRRKIEMGQAQVAFIQAWIQARQLLGPLGEDARPAQQWLDRCYATVRTSQRPRRGVEPAKEVHVLRRLLLLRPLRGAAAQVWRIIYWLLFLTCNIYVVPAIAGVVQMIQGTPGGGDLALGSVLIGLVFAVLAGMARVISVHQDEAARKPTPVPHWPTRTPHDQS
ncbi:MULTISPECIES: hypothetical protein [Streptomyces]|uniref:DUF4239 domain-containing protein n=1 Tax=Streptomyces luteosporeus TaxID=173856 RepID=A0ABN3TT21_9ACTN